MSNQLLVTLAASVRADTAEWQASINSLGLSLRLPPNRALASDTGWWPCALGDRPAGFEVWSESDVAEQVTYALSWGGELLDLRAATEAAAGLCHAYAAVVRDDAGDVLSQDNLIALAQEVGALTSEGAKENRTSKWRRRRGRG